MDVGDEATLAVNLKSTGADKVTSELVGIGVTGESAVSKVQKAFQQFTVTAAQSQAAWQQANGVVSDFNRTIDRLKASWDAERRAALEVAAAQDAVAASASRVAVAQEAIAVSSGNAFAGLGRIRQGLTSLVAQATGTIPVLDRVAVQLLQMEGGGGIALAVIGGLAAIALGYRYLEKDAREAAEAQEKYLKDVRDEITKNQNAWHDMTVAAAQANVAQSEADLANAKRDVSRGGIASKADDAAGGGFGAAQLKVAQKEFDDAHRLWSQSSIDKSAIETKSAYDSKTAYDDQLAMEISHNIQVRGVRADALKRYKDYGDEIERLAKSQTDNVRLAFDVQEHDKLKAVLYPTSASKIDIGANDTVAKLQAQTESLLKENAARAQGTAALDAWKIANAGALAAQSELQKQVDAVARAQNENKTISDTERAKWPQEVANVRAAAEAYEGAKISVEEFNTAQAKTKEINAAADALTQENAALLSGASTRAHYAADLKQEKDLADALLITDYTQQAARIVAIGRLHDETIAHDDINAALQAEKEAVKQSTAAWNAFNSETQRISDTLNNDLHGALERLSTTDLSSFKSAWDDASRSAVQAIGQIRAEMEKMSAEGSKIISAGAKGWEDQIAQIESEIATLGKLQGVLAGVAIITQAASSGYQIGSQSGSGTVGALGGAASGALAGAAIGSIVPVIGTAIGAAAGALVGAAAGLFGASEAQKSAAAALAAAAVQLNANIQTYITGVPGNSEASQVLAENQRYQALVAQLQGYADMDKNKSAATAALYTSEFSALADAHQKYLDAIKATTAAQAQAVVRASQDLDVRLLTAQGHTQDASDAAFRNQQQREIQDARTAGQSDAFISQLTATQVQEAMERAAQQEVAAQTTTAQAALAIAQQQLTAQQQTVQTLQGVHDSLTSWTASLALNTALTTLTPVQQARAAAQQFDALVAKARGGDTAAAGQVAGAATADLTSFKSAYASSPAYAAESSRVQQAVTALTTQYGSQMDTATLQLSLAQKSVDTLTAQLTLLQSTDYWVQQMAHDIARQTPTDLGGGSLTSTNDLVTNTTGTNSRLDTLNTSATATAAATKALLDAKDEEIAVLRDGLRQLIAATQDNTAAVQTLTTQTRRGLENLVT